MGLVHVGNMVAIGGIIVLAVTLPISILGRFVTRRLVARGRRTRDDARPIVQRMLDEGQGGDEIAATLLDRMELPPGMAIALVSESMGIPPREAVELCRPHLSQRHQDLYDRMSTKHLDANMAKVLEM